MMQKLSTLAVGCIGAFTALSASDISQTVPDNMADPKTIIASIISVVGAIASQLIITGLKKLFKINQKNEATKT